MVDTSLPNEILAKSDHTGVTIPSNILHGGFVQMTADNNNKNEETIDDKNTIHNTIITVHQCKQFGPTPSPLVDSCRRALAIEEVSLCGQRPPVTSFLMQIKME